MYIVMQKKGGGGSELWKKNYLSLHKKVICNEPKKYENLYFEIKIFLNNLSGQYSTYLKIYFQSI